MAEFRKKYIKIVEITQILVVLAIIFVTVPSVGTAYAASGGSSSICIEQSTRRVLGGENISAKLPMASTTKIMTALAVITAVPDLDATFKIPKSAVGVEGSSIYLSEGEERSFRYLLYGLMLRSGNDAAVALAVGTSGSLAEFVTYMNRLAKELGAENSNFENPHGLHSSAHYTTAYDLAIITAAAMEYDVFREIVGCKHIAFGEGENTEYFQNKNKMLWNYAGANGVKTGYTVAAGRCLVAAAERNGMQLISVVLNRGAMWEECARLMDSAFSAYKMKPLYRVAENVFSVSVTGGKSERVLVSPDLSPHYPLTVEEQKALRLVYDLPQKLSAPVAFNEKIGKLSVYVGEHLLFVSNLTTMQSVEK